MTSRLRGAGALGALLVGAVACGRQPLDGPFDDGSGGGAAGQAAGAGATGAGAAGSGAAGSGAAAGTGPASRSASWLFFDSVRDLNRDIYAVRADGSALHRLTTSAANEREPAVSADGKLLAYSSDESGTFQVVVMRLPKNMPQQVTNLASGAGQPAWSPDGSQLAFQSGVGVWVAKLDGKGGRMVAAGVDATLNADAHPVFTPDGHTLVFDRGNQINRLNLDTGEETSVVLVTTTTIEHPSISPDGTLVAFDILCFFTTGDTTPSLWLVPLAAATFPCMGGSRVTAPGEGPARFPAFSPDGVIAFEHGAAPNVHISVIARGGAATEVTSGGDDRNPSWSPASLALP